MIKIILLYLVIYFIITIHKQFIFYLPVFALNLRKLDYSRSQLLFLGLLICFAKLKQLKCISKNWMYCIGTDNIKDISALYVFIIQGPEFLTNFHFILKNTSHSSIYPCLCCFQTSSKSLLCNRYTINSQCTP